MKSIFNSSLFNCIIIALLLMCFCCYNGYPLTDGDTHAYIYSGIHYHIPNDRTPFYGLFLRITSLWTSLWFTAFAQSLVLAYVLTNYIGLIYAGKPATRFLYATAISVIAFTCVAWVSADIMPDIFGGILLLAVFLYLFDNSASSIKHFIYILIIAVCISVHNSHFLIVAMFSFAAFIYALLKKNSSWLKKNIVLMGLSILFFLFMCVLNGTHGRGYRFSTDSYKFMMTKFAESGILKKYLDDNCGKKDLKFCKYKDQINPYPWGFMYYPDSPIAKLGGWDSCHEECNYIIHDVFTTPKYLIMYMQKSVISTLKQLGQVNVPEKPINCGSPDGLIRTIQSDFNDETGEFGIDKQNANELEGNNCNAIYMVVFVLSSIWILLFYSSNTDSRIFSIYCWMLLFFIINAFVTATFSTVFYRFQNRIFWILPATNLTLILKYYFNRYEKTIQQQIKQSS